MRPILATVPAATNNRRVIRRRACTVTGSARLSGASAVSGRIVGSMWLPYSDDEKHRLAVARVVLQRPRWVVIHSVLNLIDPASRTQIEALFTGPLADVGVIHVGNDENNSGFFTRTLQLVRDPNGPSFNPAAAVGASDRIEAPPQTLTAQ